MVRSFIVSLSLTWLFGGCSPEPTIFKGETMGTFYSVTIEGHDLDSPTLHKAVKRRLDYRNVSQKPLIKLSNMPIRV